MKCCMFQMAHAKLHTNNKEVKSIFEINISNLNEVKTQIQKQAVHRAVESSDWLVLACVRDRGVTSMKLRL